MISGWLLGAGCPGKSLEKIGPGDKEEPFGHFTNEDTVSQRGDGTCPKSPKPCNLKVQVTQSGYRVPGSELEAVELNQKCSLP